MKGMCTQSSAFRHNQSFIIMANTFNGTNPLKVGDILHHQFHCTMSFPEFFIVTKTSPKCVWVVELNKYMSRNGDGYGQAGDEMPIIPEKVPEGGKKCALRSSYHGVGALIDSYYGHVATLWDGKPKEFYGD